MKIGVIGTGLIGASLAGAFRQLSNVEEVIGYDQVLDHAVCAWERGMLDSFTDSAMAVTHQADLVVLAVPVPAMEVIARDIVATMKPGAILTDVGSVKKPVMEMLARIATPHISVVGGHPMAGSHRTGPLYASPQLFLGAPYLLCPENGVDVTAYKNIVTLISSIGARPICMDAAQHDKVVAIVSHLPQLASTSMMNLALQASQNGVGDVTNLVGTGFLDVTRLAASSPELWADICSYNREAILEGLQIYRQCIEEFFRLVSAGDTNGLYAKFRTASHARQAINTYCTDFEQELSHGYGLENKRKPVADVNDNVMANNELHSLNTP
jgi:prephenate dehydrogenase